MSLQLKFLAREPAPLHLRAKFERKLARAELLVKREEAGVRTYPRQLRRLAWKVRKLRALVLQMLFSDFSHRCVVPPGRDRQVVTRGAAAEQKPKGYAHKTVLTSKFERWWPSIH